jgi:site-specific DNA recombinase
MLAKADLLAANMRSGSVFDRAEFLASIIARIDVLEECIELTIDPAKLGNALGVEQTTSTEPLALLVAATKVRHGHQLRLVIPGPQSLTIAPTGRDERLVALVAEAHAARKLILDSPDKSIAVIAASTNRCRTRLGKLAAIACLAPDIVGAIVEGRQPATLTARALQDLDLPLGWVEQRALLGLA